MRAAVLWTVLVFAIGLPAPGFGQWLHYPTEGVPRNADGTPNMKAPTPRLPGGKPDFSGIWHAFTMRHCQDNAGQFIPCGIEIGGSPLMGNLGRNLPGGLPYKPDVAKMVQQRRADLGREDPHVRCLPDNPPRTWTLPHLTKIVHTPKLLVMLYEVNAMYRQIFIDGRPMPKDPDPGWNGYSTAHWDGDTLVVETAGFRDGLWLDTNGSPMSDQAKMTERITRPDYGTLDIALTIDDPKNYTAPFTVNLKQELWVDTELIDEFCLENEQSYERMERSRGK
jgi:hypothetical protein